MKQIACSTCKWQRGSRCTNELENCLQGGGVLGDAVIFWSKSLRKRVPRYDYANWEPEWITRSNFLPEELFDI